MARHHLVGSDVQILCDVLQIDAILAASNVTKGALYHHFDGKDALFEAVLDQVEHDVAERVAMAARGIEDPVEALRAGCHAWLRLARDQTIRRVALTDAPSVVGWEKWREIDERYAFGMLKATLGEVAAKGRTRQELVEVLGHMLLAALAEVALFIARAKDSKAAIRTGQSAVDELLDGLFGPAA